MQEGNNICAGRRPVREYFLQVSCVKVANHVPLAADHYAHSCKSPLPNDLAVIARHHGLDPNRDAVRTNSGKAPECHVFIVLTKCETSMR